MIITRPSVKEDLIALEKIWWLAFGDSERYIDNFFKNYYRENRVLVLEEDGEVLAMTAWFPSSIAGCRIAYLYAVATHPIAQGKGYASQLLQYTFEYLEVDMRFLGASTVPATPELFNFFEKLGFFPYFTHQVEDFTDLPTPDKMRGRFTQLIPSIYLKMREDFLKNIRHVEMDLAGITHQDGICRISGGGLFRYDCEDRICILALEKGNDHHFTVKEIMGFHKTQAYAIADLPAFTGGHSFHVRRPLGDTYFGMLRWFAPNNRWDITETAYLGLAFD
ncbi:MAG: GNAT family N-acetyltransferase [Eubacteriales bacterium]